MCDQQRLRSACTYTQSDQSLCSSLEYSMSIKLLTEHLLEALSLKGGFTGSAESTRVKMPHCWKSHVAAHLILSCRSNSSTSFCHSLFVVQNDNVGLRASFIESPKVIALYSMCHPVRQTKLRGNRVEIVAWFRHDCTVR